MSLSPAARSTAVFRPIPAEARVYSAALPMARLPPPVRVRVYSLGIGRAFCRAMITDEEGAVTGTAREREFAEGVLAIVSQDGLDAVSYRTVAARSGWSVGAVQKAFPTKEGMLDAAVALAQSRVTSTLDAEPGQPTLHRWLVGLVVETLPLDGDRRTATLIDSALAARAPYDPEVAEPIVAWDAEVRTRLSALFSRHQRAGELAASLDPEVLARAVLAFAAGLTTQLLYDPIPRPEIDLVVDRTIAALLAPPVVL